MTVFFRPSSSMEKNMKNAPKKPPAESIHQSVSSRRSMKVGRRVGGAVIQILVRLLETAFCCDLLILSKPKSRKKLFCVIVVPIKAES